MEEMLARWIRETLSELEKAKKNQNYYKAKQMLRLIRELRDLRDRLAISVI